MRRVLLAAIVAAVACVSSSQQRSYRVINAMPAFWTFWYEARAFPMPRQVLMFEQQVVRAYPQIYTAEVLGFEPEKPFHEALAERYPKYLAWVAAEFPAMQRLTRDVERRMGAFESRFRQEFPDFDYRGDIYFMNSLAAFDGAVRWVNGRRTLLFGIDTIAAIHGSSAQIEPLFDHELFHLYHRQFFHILTPRNEHEPLWAAMWAEGLATYVSKRMNPQATDRQIFGLPENTPSRAAADLPRIARELLRDLDSTSRDEYRKFFLGSELYADPPQRSGYYIGYLVVQRLGSERRLQDLAKMQPEEVRRVVERVLLGMVSGGRD
jgi:predicted Zn-dependent protease DUF2268